MVLVDTSVWVDFLRRGDATLKQLLEDGEVLVHPFVIGELALGNLSSGSGLLSMLSVLPSAQVATHEEVMGFIERHELSGAGLGYVDAHLLASVRLTGQSQLFTRDRKLSRVARQLALEH
jgi:predicted nucleic acid-binding protein